MKRSTDDGRSWGPLQTVFTYQDWVGEPGLDAQGNPRAAIAGNPTGVVASDGTIWLAAGLRTASLRELETCKGQEQHVWMFKSVDQGETWSGREISHRVYPGGDPNVWGWYALNPGHAMEIQTGEHAGRLVFAGDHSICPGREGFVSSRTLYSHVFHGTPDGHGGYSWTLGGIAARDTNESQVVGLEDGSLLLNMRYHRLNLGGKFIRAEALSSDGGDTWSPTFIEYQLPGSRIQGTVLRYTSAASADRSRILFANTDVPNNVRRNMTVKLSYDDGRTWPVARTIWPAASGYADLTGQRDGRIGLLYEKNPDPTLCNLTGDRGARYGRLSYARFGLDWLTERVPDGRDALAPHAVGRFDYHQEFPAGSTAEDEVVNPGSSSFSISFWFLASALSERGNLILSKGNRTSPVEGWSFFLQNQRIYFRVNASDDPSQRASRSHSFGQIASWHHVVGVIDRAAGKLRAYLDGTRAGWTPGGGGPANDSIRGFGPISTATPMWVGRRSDGRLRFQGQVSDVHLFDRALTDHEVQLLFERSRDGSYYLWDRPNGGSFDGRSALDITPALAPTGYKPRTTLRPIHELIGGSIVARFSTSSNLTTQALVSASDSRDESTEIRVIVERGDLIFATRRANARKSRLVAHGPFNDGRCHNVVVTVDPTGSRMYVDGRTEPAASENASFFFDYFGEDLDGMFIGKNVDSGGDQWFFDGRIDYLKIYDHVLSLREIGTLSQSCYP